MNQSATVSGQALRFALAGRPRRYDDVPPDLALRGWAAVFLAHGGPRVLAVASGIAAAHRLRLGRWRWQDAAVAGGVVAAHPFTEWLVHVHLLHRRPRRRQSGEMTELRLARLHRMHHEDPKDIDLVLLPSDVVLGLVGGLGLVAALGPDRRRSATGALTSLASLLVYEWVHFLIHAPYRPRHALYRSRWRSHRLHHFRNEGYWFGVVGSVADRLLGTAPARSEVPVSGTARTLIAADGT